MPLLKGRCFCSELSREMDDVCWSCMCWSRPRSYRRRDLVSVLSRGAVGIVAVAGIGKAVLVAGCDIIEVAAVEERASDRVVDVVDLFLSYADRDGEFVKSLTESWRPSLSSSSPPSACPSPKSKLGSSGISGSREAWTSFSRCLCFWNAELSETL